MKSTSVSHAFLGSLVLLLSSSPANAQGTRTCTFPSNDNPFLALSRTDACFCDASGTTCQPNDLCLRSPPDDDKLPASNSTNYFDTFECTVVPCDDISGDWVYLESNQTTDVFSVVATVEITQSNCDTEIAVTTSTGATTTYYAATIWQEVYWLHVFPSKQLRDAFSVTGTYAYDPNSGIPLNSTTFIQNFGSKDPQCQFFGDFGLEVGTLGSLYRARGTVYSVGQVVQRDEVPSDCPSGFPKQWVATTTPNKPPTTAPVSGPTAAAPSQASSPMAAVPTKPAAVPMASATAAVAVFVPSLTTASLVLLALFGFLW